MPAGGLPSTLPIQGAWMGSIPGEEIKILHALLGFPDGASGKEPACQCRRCGFNP